MSGKVVDHFRRRPRAAITDSSVLREIPAPQPSLDEIWERRWRERHLVYCLERTKRAIRRGVNVIDPTRLSTTYEKRLFK